MERAKNVVQGESWGFQSHHSPLSNMAKPDFVMEEITFTSAEHPFQYGKAICTENDKLAVRILFQKCPYEAKKLGDTIPDATERSLPRTLK